MKRKMVVEAARQAPWHRIRHSLLFITRSLLFSLLLSSVTADFIVQLNVESFNNPNNTDASGVCCNETEGMSACSSPCIVSIQFCIQPRGMALPVERDDCSIFSITTSSGGVYHISSQRWPGAVQLLFCVVESEDGNLVERFLIEYETSTAQPGDTPTAESLSSTGSRGAVLNFSIAIQCEAEFHGPNCDCQNTNDSTGHFTCTRTGDIECLEGYQNPKNNCIECSTSLGCSDMGGFCEQPGECICREGYAGDNCTRLVSTSVLDAPAVSPTPSSVLEIPLLSPTPSSVLEIPALSPTPSSVPAPSPTPSSLITTSGNMSTMMSSTLPPVVVNNSQSSVLQSSLAASISTPIPPSSDLPNLSSSTDTMFPPPATSTVPIISSVSDVNTPTSGGPTLTISSQLNSQPVTVMTSASFPTTTQAMLTTTIPQQTSQMISTILSSLSPSIAKTKMFLDSISQTSLQSSTAAIITSSLLTSVSTETSPTLTTPILPVTTPESSMQPSTISPSSLSLLTPLSTDTPMAPTSGRNSGNEAVIAGTVVVIVIVVVLVVSAIPCVYCIVKRRKMDQREQAVVFLDEVYNAPVTFVNPDCEDVPPRSPQLFIPRNQEHGGHPLDVIHKPTFREQVPYAETGPSSDHALSPENLRVYQFEDAEATIIANPHSLSQSSSSPQPSTPAASSLNRRSGLGFEYRDDPIGDAYLSDQYLEQSQSSSVPSRPENGQSSENRGSAHHLAPPLPPRVLPKSAPKPRAKTNEEKLLNGRADSAGSRDHSPGSTEVANLRDREEEEEEEEGIKKRVSDYLQAAQEEGEKRQSFVRDINFFTDISLDMTTQTEL